MLKTREADFTLEASAAGLDVRFDELFLRTKTRKLVRFEPNPVQERYLDLLLPGWRKGALQLRGTRDIVLKGRQEGVSTLILALFFLDTISNPLTTTVVVAHDADSTQKLFRTVKRFYDHLPAEQRPHIKFDNKNEYYFDDLDSSFYVGTAGARDFGRSATINNVLASEVASWLNGEELVAGLFEAVPEDGNIFIESTAKGIGNYYHSEWEAAKRKKSIFTPRFFAWFEHPDYQKDVPPDFVRTKDEEGLAERYGLDDRRLAWLRDKRKALKSKLPQEYPNNDIEAFLASGTPYFDNPLLATLLQECPEPIYRQNFEHYKEGIHEIFQQCLARFAGVTEYSQPLAEGDGEEEWDLEIYELPQVDRKYVIGADVAEGINAAGDPDFCSAHVIDAESFEEVAHLHGRWNTREFGWMLVHLHRFYNLALTAPERNTHGEALLNTMMHEAKMPLATDTKPEGIYCHREFDERKSKKEVALKPGWPTTRKTKTLACDEFDNDVRSGETTLKSKSTIAEMMRFVHLPGGKMGGQSGCHDDRVISRAIGHALLYRRIRTKKRQWNVW